MGRSNTRTQTSVLGTWWPWAQRKNSQTQETRSLLRSAVGRNANKQQDLHQQISNKLGSSLKSERRWKHQVLKQQNQLIKFCFLQSTGENPLNSLRSLRRKTRFRSRTCWQMLIWVYFWICWGFFSCNCSRIIFCTDSFSDFRLSLKSLSQVFRMKIKVRLGWIWYEMCFQLWWCEQLQMVTVLTSPSVTQRQSSNGELEQEKLQFAGRRKSLCCCLFQKQLAEEAPQPRSVFTGWLF